MESEGGAYLSAFPGGTWTTQKVVDHGHLWGVVVDVEGIVIRSRGKTSFACDSNSFLARDAKLGN